MYEVIHSVVTPPCVVHDVQTAMHNKRVHGSGLGTEAGDTITASFGGTELELEERCIARVDYREVI